MKMKFCHKCQTSKPEVEFHRCKSKKDVLQSKCKACASSIFSKSYADDPDKFRKRANAYNAKAPWRGMLRSARKRAKDRRVPFSITMEDLRAVWPVDGRCPILGVPLERKLGSPGAGKYSLTLDAFIPELGYVPGNICVISHQANAVKQDVTDPTILERVANWMRTKIR